MKIIAIIVVISITGNHLETKIQLGITLKITFKWILEFEKEGLIIEK